MTLASAVLAHHINLSVHPSSSTAKMKPSLALLAVFLLIGAAHCATSEASGRRGLRIL
jgi:hypothetical protein